MPERDEIKQTIDVFSASCEYLDEYYCSAFDIVDTNEQEVVEEDTSATIVSFLVNGTFLENVESFYTKLLRQLLIHTSGESCDDSQEVTALKLCYDQLRALE